MLVVIAALGRELSQVRGLVNRDGTRPAEKGGVSHGTIGCLPVTLIQSGIGKEQAQRATALALSGTKEAMAVVSLGFAGAAAPQLKAGDIVLAARISAHGEPPHNDVLPNRALLRRAKGTLKQSGNRFHTGKLLTTNRPLGPAEKAKAGVALGISAVDMESCWIGDVAASYSVPFLAIRAISDEVDDSLPNFPRFLDERGSVLPLRAVVHFLTHPSDLRVSRQIARNARRAAHSLGTCVSMFPTIFRDDVEIGQATSLGAA